MTPYQQALEYFDGTDGAERWPWVLENHAQYGYCHITPQYVIFAYPTSKDLLAITEQGPQFTLKNPEEQDTWFIYFACGNIREALKLFPYPLPYIAWRYKGRPPKVFKFDRMKNLLAKCSFHEADRRSKSKKATGGIKVPAETETG